MLAWVFDNLLLRSFLSMLTSFGVALWLGRPLIHWLQKKQLGQPVRTDGPASHYRKSGTPTMGGILIVGALLFSTLLWGNWHNRYLWLTLLVTVSFGFIGWLDDYRKIIRKNSKGLPARWKYFWQSCIGFLAVFYLYQGALTPQETALVVPFLKNMSISLGWGYLILGYFVIVGASNAVNLTDGLDGLAIVPTVLIASALGVFAYVAGYSELVVFCGALVGAGLGFLWFNTFPALVFMGDVGSLALGAALGVMAIIVRQEIVLFMMSLVFVMETLSVILQVASYRLRRGKRIFKMAPIHHHFELSGCPEPRIIVRFWILTVICVLIGLTTLM